MEPRWRHGIDLETQGWSLITVPIKLSGGYALEGHYSNGTVAVLQMVLGLHSPLLHIRTDDYDNGIGFQQVIQSTMSRINIMLCDLKN